jgi:hypothetical protein
MGIAPSVSPSDQHGQEMTIMFGIAGVCLSALLRTVATR